MKIKSQATRRRATLQVAVADEVWVAAALLHREHPDRADFEIAEIVSRAERERLHPDLRPGVYVHVVQHAVANRHPNPGRYRILYETRAGHRRLFRPGDDFHPRRDGAKTRPSADDLPEKHRPLLAWYDKKFVGPMDAEDLDPILRLRGAGRDVWADEDADAYVKGLREGWS